MGVEVEVEVERERGQDTHKRTHMQQQGGLVKQGALLSGVKPAPAAVGWQWLHTCVAGV